MLDFIQQLVSGVALGCVYGLIALGFVLIYKSTEVVNFAQGDLMMLGGFFAFTFIGLLGRVDAVLGGLARLASDRGGGPDALGCLGHGLRHFLGGVLGLLDHPGLSLGTGCDVGAWRCTRTAAAGMAHRSITTSIMRVRDR